MKSVELKKEPNDNFRNWIIEEWKHHNTVDPFYQLKIIKPQDLTFNDNEDYYKIIYDKQEIGFIGLKIYADEIYIYRFLIDEKFRGKGIGTEVLNLIIDRARYENKDISLDVFEKNEAKKLYERVGFKNRYTNMVIKVNDNIEYKER